MRKLLSVAALAAMLGASGCMTATEAGTTATAPVAASDIVDTAVGAGQFKTLVAAVQAAGLESTLRGAGPFTVFAPVNDAFAAVPPAALQSVASVIPTLTKVLTLHVVPGSYTTADLKKLDGQSLATAEGGKLLVQVKGKDVIVGGAKIAVPDIKASNGVVHAVDTVILAPNA